MYRDEECTDALMVIECKAPYINVRGDAVFEQAAGYREILNAKYTMLVNAVEAVIYIYEDGEYWEVEDIPSFEELLGADVSIVEGEVFEEYCYEEIMSEELQEAFVESGEISEYTPHYIQGFALNLINLILYKEIKTADVLQDIGAAKRADVIACIKERAPELVHGDEIHLGRVNHSRLLEWKDPNVQSFIKNLLRYAVLRDGFRAECKK